MHNLTITSLAYIAVVSARDQCGPSLTLIRAGSGILPDKEYFALRTVCVYGRSALTGVSTCAIACTTLNLILLQHRSGVTRLYFTTILCLQAVLCSLDKRLRSQHLHSLYGRLLAILHTKAILLSDFTYHICRVPFCLESLQAPWNIHPRSTWSCVCSRYWSICKYIAVSAFLWNPTFSVTSQETIVTVFFESCLDILLTRDLANPLLATIHELLRRISLSFYIRQSVPLVLQRYQCVGISLTTLPSA